MTELAVLVPVLNRPQNVAPLVESFLAGCPEDSTLTFIDEVDGDELDAIEPFLDEARIWWAGYRPAHTWPEKINYGVTVTNSRWVLCAADDITFEPGWWDATLPARNQGYGVIGTNDAYPGERGNPAVAAGCHTCHPLISREYITQYGTVDQPGLAVHPAYSHWYVDNELVRTAMARKAWIYVREAVLRHNHFYWGRGEWDDTYAKGEANSAADQALWESRIHLIEAEEERCRGLSH